MEYPAKFRGAFALIGALFIVLYIPVPIALFTVDPKPEGMWLFLLGWTIFSFFCAGVFYRASRKAGIRIENNELIYSNITTKHIPFSSITRIAARKKAYGRYTTTYVLALDIWYNQNKKTSMHIEYFENFHDILAALEKNTNKKIEYTDEGREHLKSLGKPTKNTPPPTPAKPLSFPRLIWLSIYGLVKIILFITFVVTALFVLIVPVLALLAWLLNWGPAGRSLIPTSLIDFLGIEIFLLSISAVAGFLFFFNRIWETVKTHWRTSVLIVAVLTALGYFGYPYAAAQFMGGTVFYAIGRDDAEALVQILQEENLPRDEGTAHELLTKAIMKDSPSVIPVLVQNGFDIDARSPEGYTPLMLAVSWGNEYASVRMIQALIANGASVQLIGPEPLNESIVSMAERGVGRSEDERVQIVEMVKKAGAQ